MATAKDMGDLTLNELYELYRETLAELERRGVPFMCFMGSQESLEWAKNVSPDPGEAPFSLIESNFTPWQCYAILEQLASLAASVIVALKEEGVTPDTWQKPVWR